MLNWELLQQLLIIAMALGVITCAFIQKTKGMFESSKWIGLYSFLVNMILGIVFCLSFTSVNIVNSLWVGVFSFLWADTLYKTLEGKLKPYSEIVTKQEEELEEIVVDR